MELISTRQLERCLTFLDQLRAFGVTNIFGARPYIEQEFPEVDSAQAAKILAYWMRPFASATRRTKP